MILFFGLRSSKSDSFKLNNCSCPNCNNSNTLNARTFFSYFHIFFIPFFPTGSSTVAECSHCLKTLKTNEASLEIRNAVEEHQKNYKRKTPIWQGCGCLVILSAVLLFLGIAFLSLFINVNTESKKKKDPFEIRYAEDLKKLSSDPDFEQDSISYVLKNCLNHKLTDELDKEKFKYYSHIDGENVLVLLKIDDIKKIKTNERKLLTEIIKDCIYTLKYIEGKQVYIGVEGHWNTILVTTPERSDRSGRFADRTLLFDYYKSIDSINKTKIDTTQI